MGGVFDHENYSKAIQGGPEVFPERFGIDQQHVKTMPKVTIRSPAENDRWLTVDLAPEAHTTTEKSQMTKNYEKLTPARAPSRPLSLPPSGSSALDINE